MCKLLSYGSTISHRLTRWRATEDASLSADCGEWHEMFTRFFLSYNSFAKSVRIGSIRMNTHFQLLNAARICMCVAQSINYDEANNKKNHSSLHVVDSRKLGFRSLWKGKIRTRWRIDQKWGPSIIHKDVCRPAERRSLSAWTLRPQRL